jgi:hypothetical protein
MASMAPNRYLGSPLSVDTTCEGTFIKLTLLVSGGQYHWVSEFAPASLQKPLSFAAGWASSVGWIAYVNFYF